LVHTLFHDEIQTKMWHLPVSSLYMCGRSSVETLHNLGIMTIGDLAKSNLSIITSHLKSHGKLLWEYANGIDNSPICTTPAERKGIGNSTTLAKDVLTMEEIQKVLLSLAESVSGRLRKSHMKASMVSVEIKYSTFQSVSHQTTLSAPTNDGTLLHKTACELAKELWDGSPVRLLGIRTSKLCDETEPIQLRLQDFLAASSPSVTSQKTDSLNQALDKIRSKYGQNAIVRGSLLTQNTEIQQDDSHF